MTRRVGFRVDAGKTLGGGHVMRCLTLARVFRSLGHSCVFMCSSETLKVIPEDMWDRFEVRETDPLPGGDAMPGFDLLVMDHYGMAAPEESLWREHAATIMVIDDLANRRHDCDILLDQTYGVRNEDYDDLVPAGCRRLLGAEYALLREEFALHRQASLARRGESLTLDRVLVSLGMTDVGGIAGRVCGILSEIDIPHHIDVVLGRDAQSYGRLQEICKRDDRFQVHSDARNMAELMLAADVAIGAGGTTTWERCAMGVPSLVVLLADNQTKIADLMNQAGAIGLVGDARTDTDRDLQEGLLRLLADVDRLSAIGKKSSGICDGAGARRVVDRVMELVAERERADRYV